MDEAALQDRHEAAIAIAREAGALALARFRDFDRRTVERKGLQDEVSEADREVEALIRARLAERFPEDGVFGEEGGADAAADPAKGLWVVDPIDGTACFVAGVPVWCVSIAFVHGGAIALGVVFDPNAGELFEARAGKGARLDGRPIRASGAQALALGTTGVGFSFRSQPEEVLGFLARLLAAGGIFQRNGSGALMLAYVAAGRYLGYFEPHINAWDCLAGIALVREAGGWTNDFLAGDGLWRGNAILAAAPGVGATLRDLAGFG